jgi:hypothetical protein
MLCRGGGALQSGRLILMPARWPGLPKPLWPPAKVEEERSVPRRRLMAVLL